MTGSLRSQRPVRAGWSEQRTLETPTDLQRRLEAERKRVPFVVFRDENEQRIIMLDTARDTLSVGREEACDICLGSDRRVSRLHARFERSGGSWSIHDGGFSLNGTFVNGERVVGHRVLNDQDCLRFGATDMWFRDPTRRRSRTVLMARPLDALTVSPAQKKVLIALCRPYKHHSGFPRPASNQEIATELVLSVEAVKSHLRTLFATFDLTELPQNEKRVRLVEQAFQHGLVRANDL
jgi:pSer/pThr/pTyr-binding forkhead associated (FHA) protein